ncbi:C40 family peptidase [Mucilaginibacter segetis]|uniref:C40 family peptidase n=1 Tax=Mucilaginibacter segetis TaxID=2793071 RepID=A0A934PU66_9SPHI|nr:C40 family peptidase [Mucilaginibacter segetis]MBK0379651.1 C40 family peptidase [Mucilaginibacter segetis]
MRYLTSYVFLLIVFLSCNSADNGRTFVYTASDTGGTLVDDSMVTVFPDNQETRVSNIHSSTDTIFTGKTTPAQLINFARTLQGVPYKYGSADPSLGFDCSGFITYVFNHFGINVPRSSVDFTHVNRTIALKQATAGDLILFTGTDSTVRIVGHMGILVSRFGEPLKFIHSTSGGAYGVTETPLNSYYMGRFMKVIRIFPQNDQ